MGILAWIVVGLIAGVVAKAIMPGDGPGGIILTILLGIAGAFVGGFLSRCVNFAVGGRASACKRWRWAPAAIAPTLEAH